MPHEGMLIQIDGSYHRWLGEDGPQFTLLLAVDDATGCVVNALDRRQLYLPVVLPHREMLPKSEPLESTPTGAISPVAASHGIGWSAEA